jgi:predicted AlkP superfamily phosphohydrolase/phosphomutase
VNPRTCILAIGLEAADPDLLERWVTAGELPHFRRLIEGGAFRRLRSCTEVSSGATWPSITTGVSPAKHGMGFYHRQLRSGSYRIVKKYADDVRADFFWKQATEAGRRVAVFDIPSIYPLAGFNGAQIVGWGAEGLNWKQCSEPRELLPEVIRRFGRHPLEGWYQKEIEDAGEWRDLLQRLIEGTRARTRIVRWLLEREPWGLCLAGYPEPHWAGHYFFHLLEPSHPRYDAALAREFGGAILAVYRELDAAIGELQRAHEELTLLVFSNTGMGANYSGLHLVPQVLERLGLSNGSGGPTAARGAGTSPRWGAYAIKTVESVISARNIARLRRLVPEKTWDKYTRIFLNLGNKWPKSRAFALPGDYTGAIRINLRGREPHGRVEPGEDYERLCAELVREFLALENPATGQGAVSEVFLFRDRYAGPCVNDFPDLIVQWEGSHPIEALRSPRIGTVRGTLPDKRSGAHMTYGFLVAQGNGIRRTGRLGAADIVDIAPTILRLQGLPLPGHLEGHPLEDMLETGA